MVTPWVVVCVRGGMPLEMLRFETEKGARAAAEWIAKALPYAYWTIIHDAENV